MTTLPITQDVNYASDPLPFTGIDVIDFTAAASATFLASQFNGTDISQTVTVDGSLGNNNLLVTEISGTFMASWTVTNWSGSDTLQFYGTAGDNTIVGPAASGGFVYLIGGGGMDRLIGGAAHNVFSFIDPNDIVAGELLTGNSVLDEIWISIGSYDFSVATLTNVEALNFLDSNATATFSGNQIGTGLIASVSGGLSNAVQNLVVNGQSINLNGVNFFNWKAEDTIQINGTAGADTLIGSTKNDSIGGGLSNDTLNGGNGNDILTGGMGKDMLDGGVDADHDVFDFNLKGESKKGAWRDILSNFTSGVDEIDVSDIDAKTGIAGNQKFKWIGKQGFHGKEGELHYVKKAGFVLVEGHVNGDGKADFQIQVNGLAKLAPGDFDL